MVSTEFKQTLWKSADKLRAQMDAAEYKHLVLGLIFLKYISDTFAKQQDKVREMVSDPSSEYFISEDPAEFAGELEERDYYTQDNVFWVPQEARWETLRSKAKQPDIGSLIDSAMTAIENENSSLRGKLDKRFGRTELGQGILGELVDLISTIGFADSEKSSDLLGEVYEYFLGQFASAEGKKGGQFYTPSHVVKTLVAVLSPHNGRVYDPCCGSGGMFVQSEEFVKSHGGRVDDISIYGQESNPTTWRLAAMNLAIRGFSADLGKEPADTFARDQFPDLKFDYIMANPPFNISDWGGEKYESDPRWKFGRPPVSNANYAWLQHMLWKLRPSGQAGVVLANGSMSSNQSGEGQIREAMVRGDVVEVMISLPGQLFLNTPIPVCLWFLTNDKTANGRDRRGETLFIDARQFGSMETRVLKVFTDEDIAKIADTVQAWKSGDGYEDIAGFCKSASLDEIEKNGFILTPGRYVGSTEEIGNQGDWRESISTLTTKFSTLSSASNELDQTILEVLEKMTDGII
jgi:type I restriction enzyme M protein